jgi:hypothetical protein
MKKKILMLLTLMATLTVQAGDYAYLTFETTDGAKVSVSLSSLTLTFNGTTLKAGEQSFTLANLSKMYFSTTDESTAGIEELSFTNQEEIVDIYDMQGRKVSKEQMQKGVYVVQTKKGLYKIAVK